MVPVAAWSQQVERAQHVPQGQCPPGMGGLMPERWLDTIRYSRTGRAVSNALAPELMAADERLAEVASLLASGFLRHSLRKAAQGADVGLAILRTSSDVCGCPPQAGEPRSGEETRP